MHQTVVIFEPSDVSNFGPLVMLRHLADLPYGIYSNWERAKLVLPDKDVRIWGRPLLQYVNAETHPDTSINEKCESGYFLHAGVPAWHYPKLLELLVNVKALTFAGEIIAARTDSPVTCEPAFFGSLKALPTTEVDEFFSDIPRYYWEVNDLREAALEFDLTLWTRENTEDQDFDPLLPMNVPNAIHIHHTAMASDGAFFDAGNGPIVVDANVKIPPFVTLRGPLYLGKNTEVKDGAAIRGSIIGADCRVGGEIANSIFFPFTNKGHSGFVGNSIIGSWVNLGAGTITSNLKNNYSSIRVQWGGREFDTRKQFLGATLGDHTKTAIGTMLNTGTTTGIFVNEFQIGLSAKVSPSFTWGNNRYEINKAIQTASEVMRRRDQELTHAMEALIRDIWQKPETTLRWS